MGTRQWTAAAMLGTLVASLGLAYVLKVRPAEQRWADLQNTQPQHIGNLSLDLPASWRREDATGDHSWFTAQARFTLPDETVSLVVAELPQSTVQAPMDMLAFAMLRVIPQGEPQPFDLLSSPAQWRRDRLIVTTFSAIVTSDERIVQHTAALITSTGRQYWLIDIQQVHKSQADAYGNPLTSIMQMWRQRLCESAQTNDQRPAASEDFAAAQLAVPAAAPHTPVALDAYVDSDHRPGGAIDLLPTDGTAKLSTARVIGVIDSGTNDPDDPLYPARMLTQRFIAATDREPQDGELWSGRIALKDGNESLQAWRLTYETEQMGSGDQTHAMLRMVYYVRYGSGRGLLLELIGRRGDRAYLDQWTAPIVEWLMPSVADAQDTTAFAAAAQRGHDLAAQCATNARQRHRSAMRYYTVVSRGHAVGFALESVRHDAGDDMPWHGDALLVHVTPLPLEVAYEWRSVASGDPYAWRRTIRSSDGVHFDGMQLQSDGATLSQNIVAASGDITEQWRVPKPSAYVTPIAESFWPAMPMDGGAVVWLGDDDRPPQPHWVMYASGVWLLRPLLGFDADRVEMDDAGEVRTWYDVNDSHPLGGDEISDARRRMLVFGPPAQGMLLRRVERQTAIDTFPQMAPQIEVWEQEHRIDDSNVDTLE